jgi:hypothetical protein
MAKVVLFEFSGCSKTNNRNTIFIFAWYADFIKNYLALEYPHASLV